MINTTLTEANTISEKLKPSLNLDTPQIGSFGKNVLNKSLAAENDVKMLSQQHVYLKQKA